MLLNPEKLVSIYWYCAIIGTIVFIIKTSLPLDTGAEVNSDFVSVTDTDGSFHIFTIESIAAFFMTGGWLGWAAFAHLHYELKISLLISILSGILGMLFFSWLITQFKKLEHVPAVSLDELKDREGKAYTKFSSKGQGKIQIEFNSKLDIVDAVNYSEEEINTFDRIKVIKVENSVVYIVKESE